MTLHLRSILKWTEKLYDYAASKPSLKSWMDWYAEMHWRSMGHYKLGTCVFLLCISKTQHTHNTYNIGLYSDDIICDEIDIVQEALKRVSDQDAFDRTFRIRRAMQLQLSNSSLPREEWVKYEEVPKREPFCVINMHVYTHNVG